MKGSCKKFCNHRLFHKNLWFFFVEKVNLWCLTIRNYVSSCTNWVNGPAHEVRNLGSKKSLSFYFHKIFLNRKGLAQLGLVLGSGNDLLVGFAST